LRPHKTHTPPASTKSLLLHTQVLCTTTYHSATTTCCLTCRAGGRQACSHASHQKLCTFYLYHHTARFWTAAAVLLPAFLAPAVLRAFCVLPRHIMRSRFQALQVRCAFCRRYAFLFLSALRWDCAGCSMRKRSLAYAAAMLRFRLPVLRFLRFCCQSLLLPRVPPGACACLCRCRAACSSAAPPCLRCAACCHCTLSSTFLFCRPFSAYCCCGFLRRCRLPYCNIKHGRYRIHLRAYLGQRNALGCLLLCSIAAYQQAGRFRLVFCRTSVRGTAAPRSLVSC